MFSHCLHNGNYQQCSRSLSRTRFPANVKCYKHAPVKIAHAWPSDRLALIILSWLNFKLKLSLFRGESRAILTMRRRAFLHQRNHTYRRHFSDIARARWDPKRDILTPATRCTFLEGSPRRIGIGFARSCGQSRRKRSWREEEEGGGKRARNAMG